MLLSRCVAQDVALLSCSMFAWRWSKNTLKSFMQCRVLFNTVKRIMGKSKRSSINCFMNHAVDCLLDGRWKRNEQRLVKRHKIDYLTILDSSSVVLCRYFSHVSMAKLWNGSLIAFTCASQKFEELHRQYTQVVLLSQKSESPIPLTCFTFFCAKKNSFEAAHRTHLFL